MALPSIVFEYQYIKKEKRDLESNVDLNLQCSFDQMLMDGGGGYQID